MGAGEIFRLVVILLLLVPGFNKWWRRSKHEPRYQFGEIVFKQDSVLKPLQDSVYFIKVRKQ